MKYLTESQADEMDFGITINKMAKFMVENPQYGLFDFMYWIAKNPDNNLTSYGTNIYTVKNSECYVRNEKINIAQLLQSLDKLSNKHKYFAVSKIYGIRTFSNDQNGVTAYLEAFGWEKDDLIKLIIRLLYDLGYEDNSEIFNHDNMLYTLKTYCDYADDNKTFIDMIHEWIVKIPGTDYYIKGDMSSCDTVNKLCALMDEMDEKYNTNFEDWDKIIQKTDMELIHIVPD